MMLAGPVAHFELVKIARRRRTFVLRFVFGLILLGSIAAQYAGFDDQLHPWHDRGPLSLREMAEFGQTLFLALTVTQAVLVLGLTPALVADAIASERQTKTLHYLLASRLSGTEIVLGKLTARLLSVAVLVVLVLPVMSMLTLFGGVSVSHILLGAAALASAAYFVAGLATLVSVLLRRPRDAVGMAYILTTAWLFLPATLSGLLTLLPARLEELTRLASEVADWVWPASPLVLLTNADSISRGGAAELWRVASWMIGSQLAYGTLFVALCAWQLRPSFRRHEGRAGRVARPGSGMRRRNRIRPCEDDPVFWKEAYFNPAAGGVVRRLVQVVVIVLLAAVVTGALAGSLNAFQELWSHGHEFGDVSAYRARLNLNYALRLGSSIMFGAWMIGLGSITAAGITSEREQDTWNSLRATPLDSAEILRGKMLGALRSTAMFGVTIVALWLIGLAAGAVHPLGFVNALVEMAVLTWYVTALGTFASLKSKATWRARAWTLGIFVAPHLCCYVPSALYLLGISLWSYSDIHGLMSKPEPRSELLALTLASSYFFGGTVIYAAAAYVLTRAALRGLATST
jgi:ABC-type transport system involved in multi-copper enzyme maturation permease subunit